MGAIVLSRVYLPLPRQFLVPLLFHYRIFVAFPAFPYCEPKDPCSRAGWQLCGAARWSSQTHLISSSFLLYRIVCIYPELPVHILVYSVVSPDLPIPVVLGNTNFESIPLPLVTFIMSQCDTYLFSDCFVILYARGKTRGSLTNQ